MPSTLALSAMPLSLQSCPISCGTVTMHGQALEGYGGFQAGFLTHLYALSILITVLVLQPATTSIPHAVTPIYKYDMAIYRAQHSKEVSC